MRVVIAGAGSVGRSIARELLHNGHQVLIIDKDADDVQASRVPDAAWLLADACEIAVLEEATGSRAAYLTRLGAAILPSSDSVFQEGDLLHLASLATELPAVERTLDAPPVATEH